MTEDQILQFLIENPTSCYIADDRKTLYVLVPDSDGMVKFEGDFSYMSDERITRFMHDWLK